MLEYKYSQIIAENHFWKPLTLGFKFKMLIFKGKINQRIH